MIRIHFIGANSHDTVIPLAAVLGVTTSAPDVLAATGNRYDKLRQLAPTLFQVTPISEADVVVYPHEYVNGDHTAALARQAEDAGLPIVFFRQTDNTEPSTPPYGIVYRDSILASRRTGCEQAMPAFCDDPLAETNGKVTVLQKQPMPLVGFCGYVGAPGLLLGYLMVGRGRKVLGLALRRKALSVLSDSRLVATKFIERYQYWGGAFKLWDRRIQMLKSRLLGHTRPAGVERDSEVAHRVYREFLDNLLGSPYNLCIRGAGNFTYRFYETLAAGRIPLFVDTECVLPFNDKINWLDHCVWINVNEIKGMPQRLAKFHSTLSQESFADLQLANRQLWETWLTPESFYRLVLEDAIHDFRATSTSRRQRSDEPAPHLHDA
ncbi:MAG: hypothetical protein H7144_11505 [Burkholderiales bacterium]|nr:hypothetical protein [Phycisphaerae bacterium]